MSLEYSPRAIIAYAEFYAPFNEKKIFVEDEKGRLIHERIIEKIIGPGRIQRVFPLNGRDLTIADWRRNEENKNNIYIIDGDLNMLYGDSINTHNIHTLQKYCIENFLFDKESIALVLQDYVSQSANVDDLVGIGFAEIEGIYPDFIGLFVLYAICHFNSCGTKTVKEGGLRFLDGNKVSRPKLYIRKKELINIIIKKIGRTSYLTEKNKIKTVLRGGIECDGVVSGKSFLFPILHKILEKSAGFVGQAELLSKMCSRYFRRERAGAYADFLLSHFPISDSATK